MLECAFVFLMKTLLLMLRLSPADSFPKPLTKEEEREYLERWQAGDIDARNTLVEHNLRLVAHIIKKYYRNEDIAALLSIGTRVGRMELCRSLREYIDKVLDEREAEIIRLRYGIGGGTPKTQRETAQLCGISRSYVSRIEKKALEKLREALGDESGK